MTTTHVKHRNGLQLTGHGIYLQRAYNQGNEKNIMSLGINLPLKDNSDKNYIIFMHNVNGIN